MSPKRKLVAVFYADVAGYSRLTGQDEEGTHRRVMDVLDWVTKSIAQAGGTVLRYAGDAVLAEFSSAVTAVSTSIEIQQELARRSDTLAQDDRVAIRIGVNVGDVIEDRGEVFGDGVNLAARLESAAEPGGVCLAKATYDQVAGKVGVTFSDGGEVTFKKIAAPVRIFHWPDAKEAPPRVGPALERPAKPSVAVLPFNNMSGDPEQEYFSDGITEDIITELSRFRSLFVIARNSTFGFKGEVVDVSEVGAKLGVGYVVEGSVRKSGNRVRVTAQLIEVDSGSHVWAERYDGDLDDIFALQDEVVAAIVASLEPQVGNAERQRARRRPLESLGAWGCLQRGLSHLYAAMGQHDELEQAVAFMERAVEMDEEFASAHAGLALTLYYRLLFGKSQSRDADIARALKAARRAVALDNEDPFPHVALCRVYLITGDHEAAVHEADSAISLSPSYATAHFGRAHALWHAGRPEEALPSHDMAIRLSPRDPLMWAYLASKAIALYLTGRHEEACAVSRQAQRQAGAALHAYLGELAALGRLGRSDEAAAVLSRAQALMPDLSIVFVETVLPISDAAARAEFAQGLFLAGVPDV